MTIGDRIKEQRLKNNLSQEELGKLVGVQKAAINKYETNIVVNLKQSMIENLAKALGVSPVYLLGYEDEKVLPDDWHTPLTNAYLSAAKKTRRLACDVLNIGYVDPGEDAPEVYVLPKYNGGAAAGVPAYYDMNDDLQHGFSIPKILLKKLKEMCKKGLTRRMRRVIIETVKRLTPQQKLGGYKNGND